jgi:hypothetical protein
MYSKNSQQQTLTLHPSRHNVQSHTRTLSPSQLNLQTPGLAQTLILGPSQLPVNMSSNIGYHNNSGHF